MTSNSMKPSTCFHHTLTAPIALVSKAFYHLQQKYERLPKKTRHIMLAILCMVSFLAVGAISGVGSLQHNHTSKPGGKPGEPSQAAPGVPGAPGRYSTSMALSIIARQQGIMKDNTNPGSALQAGIVQKALAAHNAYYGGHPEIQDHIDKSTASAAKYMDDIASDFKMWPLDRLSNGNAMLLSDSSADPSSAYWRALDALRESVRINRRNNDFSFWYWESYPNWAYLDGMYSLGPFAALDNRTAAGRSNGADTITATTALEDVQQQFQLLWEHCLNESTGLLVHGYDANRTASWASRTSGASAVVWGRSLGWFMMALVDTLELLAPGVAGDSAPPPGDLHDVLLEMYQHLAPAVLRYADEESRGWFQVVDMAGRSGNYIESSATAMFAYALLKGARLGYLNPKDLAAATDAGRAAHALLVREFVTGEEDGTLGWSGTVAVCSLNSTADYDYYIEQPTSTNSVLGAAPFILASLEVERLEDAPNTIQ